MHFPLHALLDELDTDPERAMTLARELGIEAVGLRMLGERRFPDVAPETLAWLRGRTHAAPRLALASPGCNKGPFDLDGAARMIAGELEACFEASRVLGIRHISLFSWSKAPGARMNPAGGLSPDAPFDALTDALRRIARRAADLDFRVTIEVGYACWGDTGLAVAELLSRVDEPNLRMLWDPSNSLAGRWLRRQGDPSAVPPFDPMAVLLDELASVAPWIDDVHVRDIREPGQSPAAWDYALPGGGVIDWPRLMQALWEVGYRGALTLEHHLAAKPEAARAWAGALRAAMSPSAAQTQAIKQTP